MCVCVCQWYETKQQTEMSVFLRPSLPLFILTPSALFLSAGSLHGFRSMNQWFPPTEAPLAFHKQAEGNNGET